MIAQILNASCATQIPEGESGLWHIFKQELQYPAIGIYRGNPVSVQAGTYTHLARWTLATLHHDNGEVVMEDHEQELLTHLQFMLKASGHVLVCGLGLGCVTRGLLANPNVDHVTVLEKSRDVMDLVAPYMPTDRLTIVDDADALKWTKTENLKAFDCVWHDIWSDPDEHQPHLDVLHAQLIVNCQNRIERQGAWNLNRKTKRELIRLGVNIIA